MGSGAGAAGASRREALAAASAAALVVEERGRPLAPDSLLLAAVAPTLVAHCQIWTPRRPPLLRPRPRLRLLSRCRRPCEPREMHSVGALVAAWMVACRWRHLLYRLRSTRSRAALVAPAAPALVAGLAPRPHRRCPRQRRHLRRWGSTPRLSAMAAPRAVHRSHSRSPARMVAGLGAGLGAGSGAGLLALAAAVMRVPLAARLGAPYWARLGAPAPYRLRYRLRTRSSPEDSYPPRPPHKDSSPPL